MRKATFPGSFIVVAIIVAVGSLAAQQAPEPTPAQEAAAKESLIFSSVLPVHNYTPRPQNMFAQRSPSKILALNQWLKNYCTIHNVAYLDYFSALVDDKGMLKAETAEDGLHPNKAGYAVMSALAKTAIDKSLAAPVVRGSADEEPRTGVLSGRPYRTAG